MELSIFMNGLLALGFISAMLEANKQKQKRHEMERELRCDHSNKVNQLLRELAKTDDAMVVSKYLYNGTCKLKDLIEDRDGDIYNGGVRIFEEDGYVIEHDADVVVQKGVVAVKVNKSKNVISTKED